MNSNRRLFDTQTDTQIPDADVPSNDPRRGSAALLVAHCPEQAAAQDRCSFERGLSVGRGPTNDFVVADTTMSRRHFEISKTNCGLGIRDNGSTHGTFVNGQKIEGPVELPSVALVRAGQCLFVFHQVATLHLVPATERYGMVGSFHVAEIVFQIQGAAREGRHALISGPSGAGKELAAQGFAKMVVEGREAPFIVHNCALYGTEDQAMTSLFGVADRTYTGVAEKVGFIELAKGGVLYLDEACALPPRVQKALLRTIETGQYQRVGEACTRHSDARFVLASNLPRPNYGLAPDLVSRLCVVIVPSLGARLADIPAILKHHLRRACDETGIMDLDLYSLLGAVHLERLCLDGLPGRNVRALIDLSWRVASSVKAGVEPRRALLDTLELELGALSPLLRPAEPLKDHPQPLAPTEPTEPTDYEEHRPLIIEAYAATRFNVSATQRRLEREHRLLTSRKSLTNYLRQWGIKAPVTML